MKPLPVINRPGDHEGNQCKLEKVLFQCASLVLTQNCHRENVFAATSKLRIHGGRLPRSPEGHNTCIFVCPKCPGVVPLGNNGTHCWNKFKWRAPAPCWHTSPPSGMTSSQQVQSLQERLAATEAMLEEARKNARSEKRKEAAKHQQIHKQLEVACTIMVLENGDLQAALSFSEQAGLPMDRARAYLEGRLLHDALANMVAGLYATTPKQRRLVKEAKAFCSEWALARWVQDRNDLDGLAPSYEHVFTHMVQERKATGPNPDRAEPHKLKSKVQWVRRFRKRWRGRYGTVKTQHGHTETELRTQAPDTLVLIFFVFSEPQKGHIFGPPKRALFRALKSAWCTQWAPFSGPENRSPVSVSKTQQQQISRRFWAGGGGTAWRRRPSMPGRRCSD